MDKFNTLSLGEKLVLGGGALMLVASFFAWFTIDVGGFGSANESGWGSPGSLWSLLAILISIALAGLVAALRFGNMQMPALPNGVSLGMVFGGGAALVVVFMLLKAWRITAVDACGGTAGIVDCSDGFGIGFFLGVIAAAALAYGGYLLYSADKGSGFKISR